MEAQLRLSLLGAPQVFRSDSPLSGFVSSKAQALLYFLAVTARPHSRQTLIDLFWDNMREADAAANLRTVLSNLRRLLGDHLTITRQTVAFNRERPVWLDTDMFYKQLQGARSGISEETISSLRAAIELYSGDFLEGFYVRDAPNFEEWAMGQRERLRQVALQGLYQLAIYETACGQYAESKEHVGRILEIDPWHEDAHRQMMLLLAYGGQRSAALAQYESCRRVLQKELNLAPSQQTTELYQRIVDGTIAAHQPAVQSAHSQPASLAIAVGRGEPLPNEIAPQPGGAGLKRTPHKNANAMLSGFEHELARLQAEWRRVCDGETGQMVMLAGEGTKEQTRLLQSFCQLCTPQPHLWLEVSCLAQQRNSPYHPIAGLLQQALRVPPDDMLAVRLAKLLRRLNHPELAPEAVPLLLSLLALPAHERATLLDLYAPEQRDALLRGLTSVVQALAARQPVVMLIKNLQWCDPATLDMLDLLINGSPAAPILVVLTTQAPAASDWASPWRPSLAHASVA
jgi:DNA-binding SARP family transcriptional activator